MDKVVNTRVVRDLLTKAGDGLSTATALLGRACTHPAVPFSIMALGALIRIVQYAANRSLWVDEASLALNILDRGFAGLTLPLEHGQAAPIGFLFIERTAVLLFGAGEYSLRLFPLLAGLSSLIIAHLVARRCFSPIPATLLLLWFALSSRTIYFATEAKQYSSDIAATLLVLLAGLVYIDREITWKAAAWIAAIGSMLLWISHPSAFVLAGVGSTLFIVALVKRDRAAASRLIVVGLAWGAAFVGFYLVSLGSLTGDDTLLASWGRKKAFLPLPPLSVSDIEVTVKMLLRAFRNPGGMEYEATGALVALVGAISLALRDWRKHLLVILPLAMTLAASAMSKYPFRARLLVFLVPVLFLLIVEGLSRVSSKTRIVALVLGVLVMFGPISAGFKMLQTPRTRQEVRPVVGHVKENWREGDLIYVYYSSIPGFRYYARRLSIPPEWYFEGAYARHDRVVLDDDLYSRDLELLSARARVWVIFSHTRSLGGIDERELFLSHMEKLGTQLDRFQQRGAAAYLFEMNSRVQE